MRPPAYQMVTKRPNYLIFSCGIPSLCKVYSKQKEDRTSSHLTLCGKIAEKE